MTTAFPTPTTVLESILADADRLGLRLWAAPGGTGKLRYRPRRAMTPDLATRIKANREELLDLLEDTTPVVTAPPVLWTRAELDLLAAAGTTPEALPLVVAAKRALAPHGGGRVVSVELAHGRGGWTRRRVARLIRDARYSDRGLAGDLREAWGERVAICTIDGGLTEGQAEVVALEQVERMHSLGVGPPPAATYKLPRPDALQRGDRGVARGIRTQAGAVGLDLIGNHGGLDISLDRLYRK